MLDTILAVSVVCLCYYLVVWKVGNLLSLFELNNLKNFLIFSS